MSIVYNIPYLCLSCVVVCLLVLRDFVLNANLITNCSSCEKAYQQGENHCTDAIKYPFHKFIEK